ncbi:uncharacterized protein Bfra_011221 [Botrytis fragariae]|uniref:Uncharacterized protein n=1 Tax=Botrytis fragariae TaxID=1964551 RepID=A0A8H6EEY3_9HELO|nr:uncharacterized protein Bfra_011221 [Botrytis fragariae]KAF5869415.1 hypothetical protein Bfra_011221 [Botrytis fragariae]
MSAFPHWSLVPSGSCTPLDWLHKASMVALRPFLLYLLCLFGVVSSIKISPAFNPAKPQIVHQTKP